MSENIFSMPICKHCTFVLGIARRNLNSFQIIFSGLPQVVDILLVEFGCETNFRFDFANE